MVKSFYYLVENVIIIITIGGSAKWKECDEISKVVNFETADSKGWDFIVVWKFQKI